MPVNKFTISLDFFLFIIEDYVKIIIIGNKFNFVTYIKSVLKHYFRY